MPATKAFKPRHCLGCWLPPGLGGAGAEGLLGEIAGDVLGNLDVLPLKYNNYFLFSTMTFRDDVVSVGLLTKVWPAD